MKDAHTNVVVPQADCSLGAASRKPSGGDIADLLLGYWLAIEDFRRAAYDPNSFAYDEGYTLEALEDRLFLDLVGRAPSRDERASLNPLDEANVLRASRSLETLSAEALARRFGKPA